MNFQPLATDSNNTEMEDNTCRSNREQLGLQFTIDYLLYNKGRNTERAELEHNVPPSECLQTTVNETEQKTLSEQDSEKSEDQENEDNECEEEHEKTNLKSEETDEKPAQSYIALISMAILDSEEKKLLLCDIYQWIMDHYPYFKSKVLYLHEASSKSLSANVVRQSDFTNLLKSQRSVRCYILLTYYILETSYSTSHL